MLTVQTLIDDLAAGCKPKENWRIGLEHEQFAYNKASGAPLPYDGAPGIRQLLETIAAAGWEKILENGNPIALKKDGMVVSIEPGGQFEFSGSPCATLDQARAEMDGFYRIAEKAAASLGIGFLRAGFHPHWTRDDIHWMPKGRYKIMRAYMPKKGSLGIDMMLRTAGAQVNLDFSSETDMVRKYRTALAFQPVVTALMANSPITEGKDTGFQSWRSHIWTDTDPDRCGVPAFVFDDDMGFARYVQWALDVPMYFIRRDGQYIDVSGQSFRAFMDGKLPGHEGEYPALEDWHDHLSTLFPEIRLKHYLELRGPDSTEPELVYAMAAFWTGLLYNETSLAAAHALVRKWPASLHARIRGDVPRQGLQTPVDGEWEDLCHLAKAVLPLAADGLMPQDTAFLEPFYEKLEKCPLIRSVAI